MRSLRRKSAGGVTAGSSDFDSRPENSDEHGGFAAEMPITDAAAALQQQRKLEKGKELLQENEEELEEDGEDEYYEEGEEEEEEEEEGDGGEEEERADERPKLPEGFYEIEAILGKRKRKNVTQYLIKWRDWPESANTWEPLKNLQPCYDVIETFETSKGKRGRKPKSKRGVSSQSQSKKKKHSPAAATYKVPLVRLKVIEDPLPPAPLIDSLNAVENEDGEEIPGETAIQGDENGTVLVSPQVEGRREMDLSSKKICKAKGSGLVKLDNSDGVSVHVQEEPAPDGGAQSNGVPKVNGHEASQSGQKIGARRRKSGAVKRFKPDSSSQVVDNGHDAEILTGCTNIIQNDGLDSGKVDSLVVTEIIKAIEYSVSASDKTQDVTVTFMVMRSDGTEGFVSNKYLKDHYPLLLINYYEQRLRYSSHE